MQPKTNLRLRAKTISLVLFIVVLLAAVLPSVAVDYSFYTPPTDTQPYPLAPNGKVKNVILFIGDGMGLSQLAAARIAAVGATGKIHIERMPVTGLLKTHAFDALVTDSAAAATALATGYKTKNGRISVGPNGEKLTTVLEAAKGKGLAAGLVATTTITHATPASFAAHVESRADDSTIAAHLIDNRVDVLLGGGMYFFLPPTHKDSRRTDKRDLLSEARNAGYKLAETREEMTRVTSGKILGLFQLGSLSMPVPDPSLVEMTTKAIELLAQNKKGFFLMVEGSHIDPYCHGNDATNAIKQTLFMDQAVKVALDFAVKNSNTLVLVTNDHETGGLGINGGSMNGSELDIKWTTTGHTAMPAPIYAFGPKAIRFTGVHDNTDVPKLIAGALGIPFPGAGK